MKKKIAKSMFMTTGALSLGSMLLTILSALVLVIEAIVRSCSLLSAISLVPVTGWVFVISSIIGPTMFGSFVAIILICDRNGIAI